MCFLIPTLSVYRTRRLHHHYRKRNTSNLIYPAVSSLSQESVVGGLWNCQSAVQKADFISALASHHSLDFLALTETWITPENSATPAALCSAFNFSHSPRHTGRGGGTGLLLSRQWSFTPLSFSHLSITSFECHGVSVSSPAKLHIIVIYRPPCPLGNFVEELDTLLSTLPIDGIPLILLGDFNLPSGKLQSSGLLPMLSSFDLILNPTTPTHRAGNTLDLLFSRPAPLMDIIVTPLHCSDHNFLSFTMPISALSTHVSTSGTTSTRRNLHSLQPDSLASTTLNILPHPDSFSCLTVDTATDTLLSSLSTAINVLCPLSSRTSRSSPPTPWMTDVLRKNRRELRKTERKWRKSQSDGDLHIYQSVLTKFSSDLTTAKSAFYKGKIEASKSDPRKLFSIFSSLLNPPSPPPQSSLSPGVFVTFFEEKVNKISQSFPSASPLVNSPHSLVSTSLESFSSLSTEKVLHLLQSSNPTTCPLDPIPSTLLQSVSADLLPFITFIINSSLTSGHVPPPFKMARVVPILKKPTLDSSDAKNYRPVSLLSFLSKILERAVFNQLSLFLTQNQLQDPNQSAYRPAHSTETALIAVTEKIQTARTAKLSSVLILLDLSAAFDTVNHTILLSILTSLGITGSAWKWFKSYLEERSFQVTWKGSTSPPCKLSTGVPQGSVLGPLLFSLYTRSLGHVITSHGFSYHCYADDIQLVLSFPPSDTQVYSRISACLTEISSWMTAHHLKLNPSKTELLFIPASPSPHQDLGISFETHEITPSKEAKSLGVILDEQLSFSAHVANLTRSCRFLLYNIRRIRSFLTQEATQLLVQSLVISRLDYCNSLLAGLPLRATRPLQLIQNAAARLVFNLPKFSHVTPLLRSLHWLPVAARIRFKTLMLAYKAKNGPAPSYLMDMVKSRSVPRALRASSTARLDPPAFKTHGRQASRCFSVLAPRWWNELPLNVRTADSLAVFKRRLKTHLFVTHLSE